MIPTIPSEIDAAETERLRGLSLEQRGRLLALACRAAARIERSRVANGLPRTISIPWPESTWEFLRRNGPRTRR